MAATLHDIQILRLLARQYLEICQRQEMDARRRAWRVHNSLKGPRQPLIYTRAFAWHEMTESTCQCRDPFLRGFEDFLRYQIYWDSLGDDSVFEPWVTLQATRKCTGWGLDGERKLSDEPGGSFKVDYPLKAEDDLNKLRPPWHEIDEAATQKQFQRLANAIGDILPINVDRGPAYRMWTGDISTDLGYLRGIENFMLDLYDRPVWLHRLLAFLRDGIWRTHQQAEAAGDWGLGAHQNQAMPYAEELPDPACNHDGVPRRQLWGYMAAQEYNLVSPALHDEFLLQYQLPILQEFGLVAYGCCEDLTRKIKLLRKIPNLRRIAVSPFANVARCAEQIGGDYVFSYRPSPTEMVGYDFDPQRIRAILRADLRVCQANGCHVDITLKDVETVQNDPQRVRRWVQIARQVSEELYG